MANGSDMPPWLPDTLDEHDLAIIGELSVDGRASFSRIANRLEMAEATVRKRIKRLQDRGIIDIVAVPTARAYENALMGQAQVKLIGDPVSTGEMIALWPEVTWLSLTAGDASFLLEFVCSGREAFLDFVQRLHDVSGVTGVIVSLYLKTIKRTYVGPLTFEPSDMGDAPQTQRDGSSLAATTPMAQQPL
jgi:Lrp/AsnC family transcriptional regulator, regulator for asnA, asnC and gidA